jgi:hypothetical protein
MPKRLRHLWNRHRILLAMFAVALALTAFFAVRMGVSTVHWSDPGNRDLAIEGWMPVRFVARSWNVPPEVLGDALALMPGARRTVSDIAEARNSDVATIRAEMTAAIIAWRAGQADD